MILNLNIAFMDYIKDTKNLPLICVIAAVVLVILVLVIVMIVRAVKNKNRNRSETEEAVRALANVPPDEEYLPYSPEEETPVEKAEEPAAEPVVVTEPEPVVVTEPEPVAEKKESAPAEEKKEPAPAEEKTGESDMAKKSAPAKKPEPQKKEVKKAVPAKKPEPVKKPEAPKVSAANGKWVIEEVNGKFWLSLIAPNGQVMLESPTAYASLQSARAGVKTYQDNIAAERFEITEHKNGDSQVQVLNGRGSLLATSSTYSSRAQAESARDSIKRWASTTAIEEVSKKD